MPDTAPGLFADLRQRIARVPRLRLACLPTPLQEMKRLSAALGGPRLFVKRDDLTGLAFGGNKVRNWEFRLPDLVDQGAETAILGLDLQSNSARQSTAACIQAGLRCILVLEGKRPNAVQGNLLIDFLLGAEVHFADDRAHQRRLLDELAARERAEGRKAIIVNDSPMFEVASSLAYMESLMETLEQMAQLGVGTDHVYISSAGKAQGGMALLEALMGHSFKVHGVTATAEWKVAPRTLEIARATAKTLGIEVPLTVEDIVNHAGFVGPGYGKPSEASIEAVKLFARTEGLILDPIYSGKCAAGLLAHIREGRFKPTEAVVFVHTGGTPAVFNYPDLWLPQAG